MTWQPLPEELWPFPHFLCYLLRELNLADEPTLRQLEVADWMSNGPDRSITTAFRGLGKSFASGAYSLWRLRHDPFNEKVLIPAATAEKAEEVATFMARCIRDVDILRCLEPRADGRSSVKAFDVGPAVIDQSPSVRTVGILSPSLTGKRCTLALPDDIETLNNSITALKRERLAQAITELEAILKPATPGFDPSAPRDYSQAGHRQVFPRQILYLGTPHLESSLYLRLVRERNYSIRFWPARFPNPSKPDEWDCYEGNLAPSIAKAVLDDPSLVGAPTDPERFGDEELRSRESRMTRASVQLQFMLNCRLSTLDRYPIRLGDLIVMDLDGKALPELVVWASGPDQRIQDLICVGLGADRYYHRPMSISGWVSMHETWRCVLAIDPSGRGDNELAWAVIAELGGNLFLLECGGTTKGYAPEVLELLAARAKRWGVKYCVAESNMGDGMFKALLDPVMARVYPVSIEEVRVSQQKERRIVDTLAPLVQQHRLVVASHVVRADYQEAESDPEKGHQRSLMYQLSRITTERGSLEADDRIDVVAIGAAYFTEAAAQDQTRQAQARASAL
ncbi:MAG: phage terminase large subunit, partial [Synechococcaceae cyanobacterium]|nr:phage terminase large subunit [Synechococcaceae cyanobacterium]